MRVHPELTTSAHQTEAGLRLAQPHVDRWHGDVLDLLKTFSWQELKHHPWRNAAAVVAVMLGVALAFSVHLINASALDEFSQAARAVGGQADLSVRGVQGQFDETLFARVARHPQVAVASPVLEMATFVITPQGKRNVQVLGVDALAVASTAPELMPLPTQTPTTPQTPPTTTPSTPSTSPPVSRYAVFSPGHVFLNPAAQRLVAGEANTPSPTTLQLQSGLTLHTVQVAGTVRASGRALMVMDIGAAQDLFGKNGQLSRIDLRLQPGTNRDEVMAQLQNAPDWPAGVTLAVPQDNESQLDNLSRAYRVNLTVLALIALFTGAFLVFSVLSLSVAKRAPQLALLGVLGLSGRERLALVLWESLALGLVGSAAGVALGTALAALALRLMGGDLGGGFFAGSAPSLQWHPLAALVYGALGVAAALVGGWWPARAAQQLPPAQTLKGLGHAGGAQKTHWFSVGLIAAGAALTQVPPVAGIAVGAYVSVALLLVGGITALPVLIGWLLDAMAPRLARHTLPLLAVARARHLRETAAVAVSGVVASLSLAVALTVMVASFRDSVTQWLDHVLPADLYVRSASQLSAHDTVYFSPEFVAAARALDGVKQLQVQRQLPLLLQPSLPAVALIARELGDPNLTLPLVSPALPVPAGHIGIYVSEAVVDLHGAQLGQVFAPLTHAFKAFRPLAHMDKGDDALFYVAGVWRDYARQSGAITMDRAPFLALTGDERANDLALWLTQPSNAAQVNQVKQALKALANRTAAGVGDGLEFGSASEIRAVSLRIFDRSFAVTYWLQAVAIAIGLFGVAASFSAQVLSRRKEFGLLAHLGLTRRQILKVVALEGAAWTTLGALAGLGLGLVVAVVLVHVVNPQSFHWTMDLMLPWAKLVGLCLAVVVAGTVTAWLSARAAAGQDAVLAVKEDW